MSKRQIAKALGVSHTAINKAIRAGRIDPSKSLGRIRLDWDQNADPLQRARPMGSAADQPAPVETVRRPAPAARRVADDDSDGGGPAAYTRFRGRSLNAAIQGHSAASPFRQLELGQGAWQAGEQSDKRLTRTTAYAGCFSAMAGATEQMAISMSSRPVCQFKTRTRIARRPHQVARTPACSFVQRPSFAAVTGNMLMRNFVHP